MSLFQGKPIIIHLGGTSKSGHSEAASTRLFHIRQSSSGATRAVEVSLLPAPFCPSVLSNPRPSKRFCSLCLVPQVEASSSNLNSNDVFVLKTPKALFVWRGAGATDKEMEASKHVAGFLGGNSSQVTEGKEPGTVRSHSAKNKAALVVTQTNAGFIPQLTSGPLLVAKRTTTAPKC